MFKCIDRQSQNEIILLDAEWAGENRQRLRDKGKEQALLCPECKQPVLIRDGEIRRTHFAHKTLNSCPLRSESPAVLQARALLYKWLRMKFGKKDTSLFEAQPIITVEKMVDARLPRPVDCYVELPDGKKIAYWITEKGVKDRAVFNACFTGISLNVVFLSTMMRLVQRVGGESSQGTLIDLTPTERDFLADSKYSVIYDKKHWASAQCLHYLDPDTSVVTTLRGFKLDHSPQRYSANAVIIHPLPDILTNKKGEFIHPGEHEQLLACEKAAKELERKLPSWAGPRMGSAGSRVRPETSFPLSTSQKPEEAPSIEAKPVSLEEQERAALNERRLRGLEPMTCRVCGKLASWNDCTECHLLDGSCLCRDCNDQPRDRDGAKLDM